MTDGRHAVAEDTSLALHAAVADRIRADRAQLEHVIRAAATIAGDAEIVVIGSHYAQGVGERTVVLPEGWQSRLVAVPTSAGTGLCLEPHDLVISKCVAGREKDRDYVRAALRHRLVDRDTATQIAVDSSG